MKTTVEATFTVDDATTVLTFIYKDLATCMSEVENTAKQLRKNHAQVSYTMVKK